MTIVIDTSDRIAEGKRYAQAALAEARALIQNALSLLGEYALGLENPNVLISEVSALSSVDNEIAVAIKALEE